MAEVFWIFTVDGDWAEYFLAGSPPEKREPDPARLKFLIREELKLARAIGGRFVHFVHASPLAPDFFLQQDFLPFWKEIEAGGGEIGVHCHEEDLYRSWYYADQARMEQAVSAQVEAMRRQGLSPRCYRGGFMTFSPKTIPILEENGIFLDFSCDPGRHLEINGRLVADWRGAPDNYYRLSYDDHRRPGDSRVIEVPLGIYIEKQSLWSIWREAGKISRRPGKQILSVLGHTYDLGSRRMRLKLKLALLILKRFGRFIDCRQALREAAER